jgi:CHAT domain-containing protein/Flp pilus assembly protein TadD
MACPAKLLSFALCSALLVPAVQLVGGLQPLQAARSGEAARDRVLWKHPVPNGLQGVGDRFLNGNGAGDPVSRQEPVPLSATQIPGFLGVGDPLQVDTTPEPWDLDPLNVAEPQVEPSPLLAKSPPIVAQADSRLRTADQLLNLGIQQYRLGQLDEALESWQLALALYQAAGNRQDEGTVLGNIGVIYHSLGQYEQATEFFRQHLEISREISDLVGTVRALGNLGEVYQQLNQYERVISSYEQRLEAIRVIDDLALEALTLRLLGNAYFRTSQYEKAIESYEYSLNIAREIGQNNIEVDTLMNLGNVYFSLGQYELAIDFQEQALSIAQEVEYPSGEISVLTSLGIIYDRLGQYELAIDFYEQSLAIAQEINKSQAEAIALGNLGITYRNLGQYQLAVEYHLQSLAIDREVGNRQGEANALINLSNIYLSLGSYQQAIDLYLEVVAINRAIGDLQGEASTLGNLGVAYFQMGEYERAINLYNQRLEITREIGDRAGEGESLGNLGSVYLSLRQYELAIDFYEQSLFIRREIGARPGEAYALGNLGSVYASLGQTDRALEQYGQAVSLFNQLGTRAEEALLLSNIGKLLNRQGQPELAITFLKASVDIRESIRGEIRQLDRDLQQAFTDTIADDYRLLAELLLQSDRVLEAQEILDLLKLQELDDYELRNVRGTSDTEDGIAFWPAEQAILDRFYAFLQNDDDLQTFFASTNITEQVVQLQRNARGQNLNPEQLAKLQDNLQQAGNAALLYPLILEDRLELVLVTTSGLVRRTVPLDRVELNRVIAAFRSDLTDRFSDPRPNAQQLYDWLIAPLVADLEEAEAETILYAADGQLRYIPLAALHDGDQWLTDRFTINHITAASLTDFSPAEAQPLSILAGAFPAQDLVIEVAGEQRWFNGLPFAQAEVENLQANLPGTQAFFSAGFNRQAIEPRLADHTVIHLATHGTFRSGHPNDSFILLGDGDRITLFDLDQWELPNATLVVLSACETAVSGPELGTGEEILGFGYQIQRTGARAAIASLWVVSDGGTQALMDAFYLAVQAGYPKAEALRRSQRALIADDLALVGGEGAVRAGARPTPLEGQGVSPLPGYSHPYYWAPFILIGNGL